MVRHINEYKQCIQRDSSRFQPTQRKRIVHYSHCFIIPILTIHYNIIWTSTWAWLCPAWTRPPSSSVSPPLAADGSDPPPFASQGDRWKMTLRIIGARLFTSINVWSLRVANESMWKFINSGWRLKGLVHGIALYRILLRESEFPVALSLRRLMLPTRLIAEPEPEDALATSPPLSASSGLSNSWQVGHDTFWKRTHGFSTILNNNDIWS